MKDVEFEVCFNVELNPVAQFSAEDKAKLVWLFSETFEPALTAETSHFASLDETKFLVEVGPRLAFRTAWSSNCSSICEACGVRSVGRIEVSRRYLISTEPALTPAEKAEFTSLLYDRMTECVYESSLTSFINSTSAEAVKFIDILGEGASALEKANEERGLGFDAWDIEFYSKMFVEKLGRNPTDVECFDLAQSNSEHSRHWFFGGKMVIDGDEKPQTLFSMVKGTLSGDNSIIAFHDNSSSIRGLEVTAISPTEPGLPSSMIPKALTLHPILTAETHNFPTGVAPFAGAETGTGGRLRDVQATGRGAHSLAGISSYCVGNLCIPGHPLPWEVPSPYPNNLARPLEIILEASNGASDYGNKYGEPVVAGFTRSFGQRLPNGNRVEWIKPIMFTAGIGQMVAEHAKKGDPVVGMVVCKLGGPAYRIGMGGGAASSRPLGSDEGAAALDFNAVQRGDAEMENRMNRVVRACIELGPRNPIVSIHDQGNIQFFYTRSFFSSLFHPFLHI
jgi:phosphoribosylformylglycinamidine synthase